MTFAKFLRIFILNDENKAVHVGGVKYTVKDGIIYDAKKLLEDVWQIVAKSKQERGGYQIVLPGLKK
mgnify:CR=1 FL=1